MPFFCHAAAAHVASTKPRTVRNMAEQLALSYGVRHATSEQWQALLAALESVVQALGPKQVAFDLDVAPSALAHALKERDRHYVRAEWLPYLVTHAPNDAVVALIASWRGLVVEARPVLTPEQKLARLEAALAESFGADVAELVRRKAGV